MLVVNFDGSVSQIAPFRLPKRRKLCGESGEIWISEDFFDPLPEDMLKELRNEKSKQRYQLPARA